MDIFIKMNLAYLGIACIACLCCLFLTALIEGEKFLEKHMSRRAAKFIMFCVFLEVMAFAAGFIPARW